MFFVIDPTVYASLSLLSHLVAGVAGDPVPVAERPHPQVVEAALQRVPQLVEGGGVGQLHGGQAADLRPAVQAEGEGLGLAVERLPRRPATTLNIAVASKI